MLKAFQTVHLLALFIALGLLLPLAGAMVALGLHGRAIRALLRLCWAMLAECTRLAHDIFGHGRAM